MLRPYQREALDTIPKAYLDGNRRILVTHPTGTGKTVIFSHIPDLLRQKLPGQILVLVHQKELLQQNAEKLRQLNPNLKVSVEQAGVFADPTADVIIAMVPTLGRDKTTRRERFDWNNIPICIVDEAHHSTATTYRTILEEGGFLEEGTNKILIGFTATPNRADGTPLADIFQKIAHQYSLRSAIEDKWLCPLRGIRVETEVSLDSLKTLAGDFQEGALASAVNTAGRSVIVVEAWKKYAEDRQTVIFCAGITHAQDLALSFRDQGINAEAIWGTDSNRESKIQRLRNNETTVITNCGVLTEGFDCPSISCIVLARPTQSTLLYTLPSLFGMSVDFDLMGKSVTDAMREKEAEDAANTHVDLSKITGLDKVQINAKGVSFFGEALPREIQQNSSMAWIKTTDGYALSIPDRKRMSIVQNLLGHWELRDSLDGSWLSQEYPTLEAAFRAGDDRINRTKYRKVARRDAKFRGEPPTNKQILYINDLCRQRGIPVPPIPSGGKAFEIINKLQIA